MTGAEFKKAVLELVDPGNRKPCNCCEVSRLTDTWFQTCDCANSGDIASAEAWCNSRNIFEAIEKMEVK